MAFGRSRLPLFIVLVCGAAIPLFYVVKRATLNGGYTPWSDWSVCSSDCGDGIRFRTRDCANPVPGRFGQTCLKQSLGQPKEEENCKIKECPIDGGFTNWGDFGECSTTCGNDGVKKRKRSCTNPSPQYDGAPCEGADEQSESCNVKPCPVDGGFTNWGNFGDCDKSCGSGVKRRTRTCSNPLPAHGGKNCEGPVDEVEECNTAPCAVNGGFTNWSEFGSCSKTCGSGVQAKNRNCSQPAPANGGKDCEGASEETQACNTDPCPNIGA